MQNTSSAVMQQRREPHDSLDFFPTPPWATRALMEHVLFAGRWSRDGMATLRCWEPACGDGNMSDPLKEYFGSVYSSDVHDYGYGDVGDFLMFGEPALSRVDWIITNPPFVLASQFIDRALTIATRGVAMFVRTSYIEGVERYLTLFRERPPTILAPFTERVPIFKGRIDPRGKSATSYCWLVWEMAPEIPGVTRVRWIPPCRKQLERPEDYR